MIVDAEINKSYMKIKCVKRLKEIDSGFKMAEFPQGFFSPATYL